MNETILSDLEILQAKNNLLARIYALTDVLTQYQNILQNFLENGITDGAIKESLTDLLNESNVLFQIIGKLSEYDLDTHTRQFIKTLEEIDNFI